jgi:hypothetical protein
MPDSVWRDIVASAGLAESTPHTITSMKMMAAEITGIREQGFAVDREEAAEELTCVAAAVRTANGEPPRYALSISFLTHRLTPENLEHAGGCSRDITQAPVTRSTRRDYSALSSSVTAPTDFLASPNSIEVWSRKNSGFSMPA